VTNELTLDTSTLVGLTLDEEKLHPLQAEARDGIRLSVRVTDPAALARLAPVTRDPRTGELPAEPYEVRVSPALAAKYGVTQEGRIR